jgi:hypothetical protein
MPDDSTSGLGIIHREDPDSRDEEVTSMASDATTRPEADDLIRQDQLQRSRTAIQLLQSWEDEGDEREQRETLADLERAIDEDRPAQRKHFP